MSDTNSIIDKIHEEYEKGLPTKEKILSYLSEFLNKDKYPTLIDIEIYDIVGETFKLNPEFFMKHIYREFMQTHERKLSETINIREMEKYIIEKFCLYEGEQILYECNGEIKESHSIMEAKTPLRASVHGRIYLTNYRIIAHGKLSASGGRSQLFSSGLLDLALTGMTGGSIRKKSKAAIIDGSTSQELPCYGFQFRTTNHVGLKKKRNCVTYLLYLVDKVENINTLSRIKQVKALVRSGRGVRLNLPTLKDINYVFKALCKNVNQTISSFIELHEIGLHEKLKRNEFLYRLRELWNSEEYQHLSNSEYLEIVEAIYKLDPRFFMSMVYQKMMSWTFPSFLNIKSEISEILNKDAI